jgi:hypothetical protein
MFSRIHEKLGTAGFVISIVALIAALTGGAYAAGALSPKIKKQITKESKKFSKKFSKQFAIPGPQGATGATGAAGAKGDAGAAGAQGAPGAPGGPGPEGSPWTAGGVLPEGETESGTWSYGLTANNSLQLVDISFVIPLEAPPTIHYIQVNGKEKVIGEEGLEEIDQPDCPGEVTEPAAAPGALCLYAEQEVAVAFAGHPSFTHSYSSGAVVGILPSESSSRAHGTWAVTAP